jgi:hypothetical protein
MQHAVSELTPGPTDETVGLRQRIENRERVLGAVLRTHSAPMFGPGERGAGPPTSPPLNPVVQDGTMDLDQKNLRLYCRISGTRRFLGPFT